jgi:Ca2+-binding EF-hand superfamily protein
MSLNFAQEFTPEELIQVYKAFSKGDPNDNGYLEYDEFSKVLSPYVLAEDQMQILFKSFDTNEDNKIDLVEFTSALAISIKGSPQQKLEALFKLYDIDHNNILQFDEVKKVLTHLHSACNKLMEKLPNEELTLSFAKAVLQNLDLNKDGEITLEEWVTGGITTPQLMGLLGINV